MGKSELRSLIAEDELEAAVANILTETDRPGLEDRRSEAIIISGRLEEWKREKRLGGTSNDDLALTRNRLRATVLELVENGPDSSPEGTKTAVPKPVGMAESRFKWLVFLLMLAGNVAALTLLLVFGGIAGGFTPPEVSTTVTMLLSVMAAYFSVMLGEFIATRGQLRKGPETRVNRRFVQLSIAILMAYFIIVCTLIHRRPLMEFNGFISWLTVLESGFGIYVGQVIASLFKKQG